MSPNPFLRDMYLIYEKKLIILKCLADIGQDHRSSTDPELPNNFFERGMRVGKI